MNHCRNVFKFLHLSTYIHFILIRMNDPIGVHGMFVLKNIDGTILERMDTVVPRLWKVANECQLTVVAESGYQFEPFGVTYILVLAESHLSIHTYPEKNAAYIDLFCCNLHFDMNCAVTALANHFHVAIEDIDWKMITR